MAAILPRPQCVNPVITEAKSHWLYTQWICNLKQYTFALLYTTVKPVCNDHLYDKIYHLWFIQ